MPRILAVALLFALVLMPLAAQKQPLTDDIITDNVRVKLANDADIGGMKIDVEVHGGAVTLTGKVRSEKMRSKAEKLAKKVKGVTAVTNKLIVSQD
ncbi:MAG TPA: BON domain-containing protein [Bryobacteraceae bacterium]|nr:BON domain-containing protein [Bryobacteraceae bacterium]